MALDAVPQGGATILVVDDDPLTRDVFCRVLARGGYTTMQAEDGLAAQDLLRRQKFALVLTDLYMPGDDGLGVLRMVQRHDPDIGVVICTAERDPGFDPLDMAMRLGALAVLSKPIDPDRLLAIVRSCLAKRSVHAA